ncbi:MAG: polysaccharide biosynthesis C-terminal domain-containing protein, partial [Gemmatimonadetes bacterium]|nr:polysaccharide biosynthesis C-terminal domain-containing protein [Gemmatimonadota bacterium]
ATTDRPAQRALYQQGVLHMVAGGLPIAIGGWVLALPLVATVFGTAYSPAAPAFAILVWSIPLSLVRDIPIVALITHGQERTVLRVTGMAMVLNIALNVALIPRFGMVGAAVATVVTEGARMVLAFIAAQRYRLGFPSWRLVWRPFAAAAAMLAVLSRGAAMPVWGVVLLGAGTYGLVLMLIGGAPFRVRR